MRFETLTIGDELLDGRVIDTNSREIGALIDALGRRVSTHTSVPDQLDEIVTSLLAVSARADLCVITGGLGPTCDDLTFEALARAAGVALRFDPVTWARIEARIKARTGEAPSEINRRQAMLPEGAEILPSEVGTAPGVALRIGRCRFYALPGVPAELRWHLDQHVAPALRPYAREIHRRALYFTGLGESRLAERVGALGEGVGVSWRVRPFDIALGLSALGRSDTALVALEAAVAQARQATGDACCGEVGIAEAIIQAATAAGLTLGAAESCTGGGLSAALTAIPGASSAFLGGVVSYANAVKVGLLGVSEATLAREGAVSEACAREMALGARRALGVDYALAITGVAGPGGGTPDKPVGLVCFGLSGPEGTLTQRVDFLPSARAEIQRRATAFALSWLWGALRRPWSSLEGARS
ncbi:CinA family nicotinamide mononucleotide deamidase-related protein [Myxococcota bacterium]|nr:CinA family nicotinamide mononucleotide deamidase-related protein [Myxococcota bacterium]MBU1431471.1 CinA family nicotinamide mononucleotide deamidase-related protein [Myxococcota bacterium]MBU1896274.1 CinA family nicotinamide mononucleotide deamidase-related protein [Myxococcota bacterium]